MKATNVGYGRATGEPCAPSIPRDHVSRLRAALTTARARILQAEPVYAAGLVLCAAMFLALCAWETVVASRFSLTLDFANVQQAVYLISHGNLDPYSTVQGFYFWQGHGEIVPAWVLGLVYAVRPQVTTILWAQAAAVVGCEAIAFSWMKELLDQRVAEGVLSRGRARIVLASGLVLLLGDPWLVWAVTFDFHWESISLLFALITTRQLWRQRQSAWIWAGVTVLCGDLGVTYVIGAALSCLVAGRPWRRSGVILLALGAGASIVISLLDAAQGSGFSGYAYLLPQVGAVALRHTSLFGVIAGGLTHLGAVWRVLWSNRLNLFADVAVGGLIGVVWPWTLGITAVALIECGLQSDPFYSLPGFQNVPELVVVPIGTVAVLAALLAARRPSKLGGRRRLAGGLLLALVVANVACWCLVWLPRTASQWLRVSTSTAATLSSVARRIPAGAEVIVSQGVAGRFAARRLVYAVSDPGPVPLRARDVWVVLVPAAGIEELPEASAWSVAGELASTPGARLVVGENGVWAFDWHPTLRRQVLVFPAQAHVIPGWAAAGPAASAVASGPSADRGAVTTATPGELIDEDYWYATTGLLEATFRYQSTGPLDLQVWNVTGDVELANVTTSPVPGVGTSSVPIAFSETTPPAPYDGFGLFSVHEPPPSPGDQLELRVYSVSGLPARIVSVGLSVLG